MKKITFLIQTFIVICMISALIIGISFWLNVNIGGFFINIFYVLSSALFFVGLGLIIDLESTGLKNPNYMVQLREDMFIIRITFLLLYFFSSISFISYHILLENSSNAYVLKISNDNLAFDWLAFLCLVLFFCFLYFLTKCISLKKYIVIENKD